MGAIAKEYSGRGRGAITLVKELLENDQGKRLG
jgi:hypothetical protein